MSLYVGGTQIKRVLVNGSDVNQLYTNGTKVWANNIEFIGGTSATLTDGTIYLNTSSIDIQANDLILVSKGSGYHTTGTLPSTPSGFTNIFNRWGGGSNTNTSVNLSYKYAVGGETSINVGGTSIGGSYGGVTLMVFRNVALSNPLDVPVVGLSGNTYTNNINPLAITTLSSEAVVVATGTAYISSSGGTLSTPDMNDLKYAWGYYNFGAINGMAWKQITNPSSFDPSSWSASNGYAPTHMTCTIALKPRY